MERTDRTHIRNFSIIAHIDHGKSTLADRLLEATGTVAKRDMEEQVLDNMELERERGITIKARAVRLDYKAPDGEVYELNLIDTPGHVDFNYEVSRSLNACEGALLVVDATQGIEAQTLANAYLAVDAGLEIVPVVNKIDLPSADPDACRHEIEEVIGIPAEGCPAISAKMGINIESVLEAVVRDIPSPTGDPDAPLRCLIFDSYYDSYLGVVVYVRVKDGTLRAGDRILMMNTKSVFDVVEVGTMEPFGLQKREQLSAGDVGYITASIKNVADTQVGDTVTLAASPALEPLPGFKAVHPMVYAGIYPEDGARYGDLRDALEKLRLNDAALSFEPETSIALGFGFRCGFLGLLHMEIIEERLEREFNLDLITTAPSVIYEVKLKNGQVVRIDNPAGYPQPDEIEVAREPIVKANIITPVEYVGGLMELCQDRRGVFIDMKYLDAVRAALHYALPRNALRYSKLCKLDFLLNGEKVDALSFIVHEEKAYARARKIAERLKENIPRQLFEIPIQAAIGSRIIARETVKAMRKDVLAKCYGGDITRKKKLLEKQKEGKKKMRRLGSVQISPEAFMAVLKLGDDTK